MALASRAIVAVMFLAVSGPAVAGPLASDAGEQFNPGAAYAPFAADAPDGNAELDRTRQIISPHIEGDVLVIEGRINSHI